MVDRAVNSSQIRRVIVWTGLGLLALFLLVAIQFVGASPVAQDDFPPPDIAYPQLGESGSPISPVIINQTAEDTGIARDAATDPEITIWYPTNQEFGQIGHAQKWVDVLGRVSTPGSSVKSLRYRLNNEPWETLSVGSDMRRLYQNGDFHIELDITKLKSGANTVEIELTDWSGKDPAVRTVTVNYNANSSWPKNYTADWSSSADLNPQDIAQVVDGFWIIQNNKLVLADGYVGYDRLVAMGEYDEWTDYEAVVPFTIKGIDPDGFKSPSNGPGIGVIMRWQGYELVGTEQPRIGWQNLGAIAWNRYKVDGNNQVSQGLQMIGYSVGYSGTGNIIDENPNVQLEFNVPYFYKVSVKSVDGAGDYYRLKVWRQGDAEPYGWDMVGQGDADEPGTGAFVLIAHHVDVEFGNVVVKPINGDQFTLQVNHQGNGDAPTVVPKQQTYSYGQEVTITSSPNFQHVLGRWEGDAGGRVDPLKIALTANAQVTAVYVPDSSGTLTTGTAGGNGQVTVDPVKSNYYVGEEVTVTAIPEAGYDFVSWNTSLMSTQAANASSDNPYTFIFGVDGTNAVATFGNTPSYNLSTATTGSGTGSILKDPDGSSFFDGTIVKVTAEADAGSQFTGWNDAYAGQTNPFYVLMDGNESVSASFEQVADTFTLQVNSGPHGKVIVDPDKNAYLYGELVTLSAVGDEGYMLAGWGGDLAGNSNPVTFGMFGNYSVSATFIEATRPVSDDFNRCTLDNGQWTVVDPLNDSAFKMTGRKLEISVPGGQPHDFYNDVTTAPRILTPADNEDKLGLEAKFDSAMSAKFQGMGILVQENENKVLRFDFYHNGSDTYVFAAVKEGDVSTAKINSPIADGSPLYMRVERDGDTWRQYYSYDGTNYTLAGSFSYSMKVNDVGVFALNPGPAPAFKAVVDYFFNQANPIVPQDTNMNTISVSTTGQGDVTLTEDKESYACGEKVTFEAKPDEGWYFIGWRGDLSGLTNPNILTVRRSHSVTAKFSTSPFAPKVLLPVVIRP